ncbi:MAG TPA: Uma2 family endonuclease [Blastocatellia bacterium]|nr:Uma2 family endonuclease [Blastocatellia bacterium]
MTTKPLATIADLELMPDDGNRYEIIEGEIIVSRSPSIIHQIIFGNLLTELRLFLRSNPIGVVLGGIGVILDDLNGVIPDIVFVSNKKRDEIASGERINGAPDLVIEILSPGKENARRDRVIKRQTYGNFEVSEYWIVDGENRSVELYRNNNGVLDLVETVQENGKVISPLLPGFELQVADIFKF